ncbi:hypothetical protein E2C01_033047 [Portunus trituberculatus]|uniref:Uncharacterized protein n=1 Tax=Portunus trituberculatus TaxID=210409 RepID=A0A5B7EWT6_PORTR|nr:hypothetical protein [Portunus trituberculatus]
MGGVQQPPLFLVWITGSSWWGHLGCLSPLLSVNHPIFEEPSPFMLGGVMEGKTAAPWCGHLIDS